MNATQKISNTGTLRFERLFPGPAERVWSYLTRPPLLATWLAEGEIELHVGGYVELRFNNREEPPALISGVVTHCDPPESLSYYWADFNTISNVIFEIEHRGHEVLLLLTHARLPKPEVARCREDWNLRLDALEGQLRGCTSGIFSKFGEGAVANYDT